MNSDLKQLIRLQSVDGAIQEIRTRIDKFPSISKALDEKLKSATTGLETGQPVREVLVWRGRSIGDV